jgi:chemotaxis protein MotB
MKLSDLPKDELPTDLWMVPYADLMSNMVVLFLALFAFTYLQRAPETERAMRKMEQEMADSVTMAEKTERLREAETAVEIQNILDGMALKDFGVRVTERYIHLTLPSPVLFSTGSDRLAPKAARLLKPLARVFARADNPILVKGHTDDLRIVGGRFKSNWELSAARAFSVIRFLNDEGLTASRFQARGYGQYRPVAPNDTAINRAKNRRIEISLLRESKAG